VSLYFGYSIYLEIQEFLKRAEMSQRESVALIKATKALADATRVHQRDTSVVQEQIKEAVQAAPVLAQAVQEVPEKTADMVVEKIKSGDSGLRVQG
jgi:hypothetical protein